MLPEVLINHNPILLFAQGLAQLGWPSTAVDMFITGVRIVVPPFVLNWLCGF
jgi:hypothetical protein